MNRAFSDWLAQAASLQLLFVVIALVFLVRHLVRGAQTIEKRFASRHRRGIEQWLLAVSGISQLIAVNRFFSSHFDDLYTAQSVLYCFFAPTESAPKASA